MSVRGRPGVRAACGAILTCPDGVSRYGARRRRTQQAGAAPYGLVAALLKANTKRVWYSKYLGFPLKRKRHSLQTHTLIWSSSLARLAAAAAMATLTAAALVAVTLVAAAAPGQQRELSLQCWRRRLGAAAGGDIAGGSHAGAALLWRRGGGVAAPCRSRPARIALAVCRRGRRIRMRPPRRQTVGWPQSRTWVKSCGAETSSFAVAGPSITGAVAVDPRPWADSLTHV